MERSPKWRPQCVILIPVDRMCSSVRKVSVPSSTTLSIKRNEYFSFFVEKEWGELSHKNLLINQT